MIKKTKKEKILGNRIYEYVSRKITVPKEYREHDFLVIMSLEEYFNSILHNEIAKSEIDGLIREIKRDKKFIEEHKRELKLLKKIKRGL